MTVHIRVFLAATMAFSAIGAPTMAATVYWSLFNIEGETAQGARYVTYSSLSDMLNDENRSGVFIPDGGSVPENVIGSGSDGTSFWSLFNIEGETAQGARYVTYSSLSGMLNDENRSGVFIPDGGSVPENVIGSGAFWVSDTTAVPIPASILFLFTGLGVLSTVRRKL